MGSILGRFSENTGKNSLKRIYPVFTLNFLKQNIEIHPHIYFADLTSTSHCEETVTIPYFTSY